MICTARPKSLRDFDSTRILTQTRFWGKVKQQQGFIPSGFELSLSTNLLYDQESLPRHASEDLLVLIRFIDTEVCYAYVPYGPKIEPSFENQGRFLEHLSEVLKPKLPAGCAFIRYDLHWKNQWAAESDYYDESGNWLGPPSHRTQEYRLNFNTTLGNLRKSPEDSLPKNTFFIDLTQSQEELWNQMRYTSRYEIRKALKNGVEVTEYPSSELSIWYELYSATCSRHRLDQKPIEFFTSVLTSQDDTREGVSVKLLIAKRNKEFLSALFLVISKNRANYLYGASKGVHNSYGASHLLQWESIKIAKMCGCNQYDLFGSAPNLDKRHPLHGVHVYKKGFGGRLFHRMGCWDYPIDHSIYQHFRAYEMASI